MVREQIEKSALNYLKLKIKSKGSGIQYDSLIMQDYLRPNQVLTVDEQQEIFSYRSRMNNLKYNYPGSKGIEYCVCGQFIDNPHLLSCTSLNIYNKYDFQYDELLNGNIHQQKEILTILKINMSKLEAYSQAQDGQPRADD